MKPVLIGPEAEKQMRRLTRRSFAAGAAAIAAGFAGWHWLTTAAPDDGVPWPLRRILRLNQSVSEAFFSQARLAPTFPNARVDGPPRINGMLGLYGSDPPRTRWRIRVQHEGRSTEEALGLEALAQLPRVDLVTELKCVEGWSEIMHFGGVRFLDFLTRFGLGTRSGRAPDPVNNSQDLFRYVYLETPDRGYWVGLDIASALHPQTLLCDTMNRRPLTREHGAPLRLYLAVKYGYKSLKRVGLIRFQDELPDDYWVRQGYDWYAGL